MDKLKVCIVCHFSNSKVREHLPLDDRRLYSFVRRIMRLPSKRRGYADLAPWDSYMIEQLRKRNDIELFVISAHTGMKKTMCDFDIEGVHYFFVRCDIATMLKHIIHSPALWNVLNPMRPVVHRIIKSIKPDIVALIGAENPHISGTVLGIKGCPLIVKCQTIYNNPERRKTSVFDEKNAYVEQKIFKDLKYVSVDTVMHERMFRDFNKNAINFIWDFGTLMPEVKNVEKEFDFVNYAVGMSIRKGYPDAIRALALVKQQKPNVKLNLVGGSSEEYKKELEELVESLDLKNSVVFTPFFECQDDLFQHIQKARIALLPCKLDYISSTIRQAMHYELPVVCYKTEGTITLNEEKQCVMIAENSDVDDLARQMLTLLNDGKKEIELRENAKEYSRRWDEAERITNQMVAIFKAVVSNYRNGTPVPDELQYKSL